MKRLLQILSPFLILSFFLVPQVKAADIDVVCPDSSAACSKSSADPLFSIAADGYWYPGRTLTKTINLKNSSSQVREMAIKGTKTSGVGILENVMNISIVGGTTVIWSGSVDDFYGQDKIGMGIFVPEANLDYDFTVSMLSGANDDYQGKETVFDLTLGFFGEPISAPTPTPTSAPGGGEVLGVGVSISTCNDTKPGSAPVLLSAVPGTNLVTLTWSPAVGNVSYYLVAYGTSSGSYQYGNPSVGGVNTTSYTVTNLSGGTTYYFVVRAGNGCAPGLFSNEFSATPEGEFITGPAAGFSEGVLGEATESAELLSSSQSEDQREVGSVKGETENLCTNTWWWWIVMVVYGIHSLLLVMIGKKIKRTIILSLHTAASIISIALLIYALCSWWLAVLIAASIGAVAFFLFKKYRIYTT